MSVSQEDRALNRQIGIVVAVATTVAAMAFVVAVLIGTAAHGTDRTYRFNLYAADRGAGVDAMRFKVQAMAEGSLGTCYALGAIAIDALNRQNPDKDFMGGCVGGEMLTLRELVDRANALLPK